MNGEHPTPSPQILGVVAVGGGGSGGVCRGGIVVAFWAGNLVVG